MQTEQRMAEEVFNFTAEWFDEQAGLLRPFMILYFDRDQTIELHDTKKRTIFLKRQQYPSVTLQDLYVGNTVSIFSRQFKILKYGDAKTAAVFSQAKARSVVLLNTEATPNIGLLLEALHKANIVVSRLKMVLLSADAASAYLRSEERIAATVDSLTKAPVAVLSVVGADAARVIDDVAQSARVGRSGFFVSSNAQAAETQEAILFSAQNTATFDNCTTCVIKPHAIKSGAAGAIISAILNKGFEISAIEQFVLDQTSAQEFLEVYNTVVPEYSAMVQELCSGPSIAMELRAENAVNSFRSFAGPADPVIARALRPDTLRARYGSSKVQNAVHCTDLPDDGALESEFFFSIMQPSAGGAAGRQ